ncbi:hypothetical protein CERSUDRAFT_124204 [Gelatoporia subvermispora B]|uniref:Uncharacterized protein n=1 Tax=Ceriporiopsis subvermispora (strain B) TaxID=914234 RepID=M2RCV1_CERS8|nr:hypothetical protein CERSUDRAFT_124204 [Gelatoporia subvermispora B]
MRYDHQSMMDPSGEALTMSGRLSENNINITLRYLSPDTIHGYAGDLPAPTFVHQGANYLAPATGIPPHGPHGSTSVDDVPNPRRAYEFNAGIPPGPGSFTPANQVVHRDAPYAGQGFIQAAPFQEPDGDTLFGSVVAVGVQNQTLHIDWYSYQASLAVNGAEQHGNLIPGDQSSLRIHPRAETEPDLPLNYPGEWFFPMLDVERNGQTGDQDNAGIQTSPYPSPPLPGSSVAPPSSGCFSVSVAKSPKSSNETDPPPPPKARKQARTIRHRASRKIRCIKTGDGPCVINQTYSHGEALNPGRPCTRYAQQNPEENHVCAINREIGKRGRPKGVKDGEGKNSKIVKGGKRAGRKTKGIVIPDGRASKTEDAIEAERSTTSEVLGDCYMLEQRT